jgi:hypothetical protein
VVRVQRLGAEAALQRAAVDARWLDGESGLGLVGGAPPAGDETIVVTGMGGELARAFHYRLTARNHRAPTLAQLAAVWRPQAHLPARTDPAVATAVADGAAAALAAAQASAGVTGWRTLDVVYAQGRMRRWARSQIRFTGGVVVPAFLEPRLAAALVALPLEARVSDGFHRAFLRRHAPELVPVAPARQRRGVPAPLRRLAGRLRPAAPGAAGAPFTPPPRLLDGLAEVAADPLVASALGARAAESLLEGLRQREAAAVATASTLLGPVALARATRDLASER